MIFKVFAGLKSDVAGLLVFGTDGNERNFDYWFIRYSFTYIILCLETDNQLNDQTGEYENITMLYPIEQPQLPILRTVNNDMPHGNVQADGTLIKINILYVMI